MNEQNMRFCRDFHELTFDSYARAQVFKGLVASCMESADTYLETDDSGNEVWKLECKLFDFLFGDEEADDD